MSMHRYLNKKYKLSKAVNYDSYLKFMKVKLFYRKLAQVDRPVVRLAEKDGKFIFETASMFGVRSIVFRTGVPFDEIQLDGTVLRSVIDFEDNRMKHVQTVGKNQIISIWEFSDKIISARLTANDIVCSMTYDRIFEK